MQRFILAVGRRSTSGGPTISMLEAAPRFMLMAAAVNRTAVWAVPWVPASPAARAAAATCDETAEA